MWVIGLMTMIDGVSRSFAGSCCAASDTWESLNACAHVTDLQMKAWGECRQDNPVTHNLSNLLQHWAVESDNSL